MVNVSRKAYAHNTLKAKNKKIDKKPKRLFINIKLAEILLKNKTKMIRILRNQHGYFRSRCYIHWRSQSKTGMAVLQYRLMIFTEYRFSITAAMYIFRIFDNNRNKWWSWEIEERKQKHSIRRKCAKRTCFRTKDARIILFSLCVFLCFCFLKSAVIRFEEASIQRPLSANKQSAYILENNWKRYYLLNWFEVIFFFVKIKPMLLLLQQLLYALVSDTLPAPYRTL